MRRQSTAHWLMVCAVAFLAIAMGSVPRWAPSAGGQTTPRTFTGAFAGSGVFSNSLCSWRTTYSGTVTLTLTFGASVTGTARHQGRYQDVLASGPAECGGDLNVFDETVPVSGSAQAMSWGYGHGASGRVSVTGSLIGNAIVGRGVVTDPEYAGSATIPFTATEVGGGPSGEAPTVVPTPATAAPTTAPTVVVTAAPTTAATATAALPTPSVVAPRPSAPVATPGASPPASGTGVAGIAPTMAPIPSVPAPKEATPTTPTINREACERFSTDPAMWQALEDHLDELDEESVPIGAVKSCLGFYRFEPWPETPEGAKLITDGEDDGADDAPDPGDGPPPRATLQTVTGFVLRAGEQGRSETVQGAVLGKGDIVVTRADPATLEFSEGTRVEVGGKSAVVMGDPASKTIVQLRGRMFMDIKSRQWHVRIPQPRGLVAVVSRGTVLTTEARDDGMVWIEVTEGSVDVTSAGKTVRVAAGSAVTVDPAAPPPQPTSTVEPSERPLGVYGVIATAVLAVAAGGVFMRLRRRSGRST